MAWAICEKCGAEVRWFAGRGMKLSDYKHGIIGYDEQKNPIRCGGRLIGKARGPKIPCAECGKKRITPGSSVTRCWPCRRKDYEHPLDRLVPPHSEEGTS